MCVSRQIVRVRAGSAQHHHHQHQQQQQQRRRPGGKCFDFSPPNVHANAGMFVLALLLLAVATGAVSMTVPDIDGVQISGASAPAVKASSIVTGFDSLPRRVPRSPEPEPSTSTKQPPGAAAAVTEEAQDSGWSEEEALVVWMFMVKSSRKTNLPP
ncbi:CRE-SPR-4 protein [Anopheles sinensis]|uniref:CRE-SPR-4 protein n=1 Tax=Anopheles sinensis TaxID=74873 RepID=A0A084WID3_ANOSI|nr:CRE-SPR-4 protein [Anopheles sinensis]